MELREQFEKLHPVPEGVSWSDGLGMYACEFLAYQNAEKRQNGLWQGFQSGYAAAMSHSANTVGGPTPGAAPVHITAVVVPMQESCGKSWVVFLERSDLPEDAKPWDKRRQSMFQFRESPGMEPPAEVRARETAGDLNEFLNGVTAQSKSVMDAAPACEQPLPHVWDRDGEHCALCGDPDWCASPICAGARCVANFELSRKDREHIAEYMTNHNKLRSEVGLLPVTNISEFLADKVMTDIRTELQTMRSSGRFANCSNEDTRTAGESDR